jgi:chromosome segregation ATPase
MMIYLPNILILNSVYEQALTNFQSNDQSETFSHKIYASRENYIKEIIDLKREHNSKINQFECQIDLLKTANLSLSKTNEKQEQEIPELKSEITRLKDNEKSTKKESDLRLEVKNDHQKEIEKASDKLRAVNDDHFKQIQKFMMSHDKELDEVVILHRDQVNSLKLAHQKERSNLERRITICEAQAREDLESIPEEKESDFESTGNCAVNK